MAGNRYMTLFCSWWGSRRGCFRGAGVQFSEFHMAHLDSKMAHQCAQKLGLRNTGVEWKSESDADKGKKGE